MRFAYGRLDWNRFSLEGGQDWSIFAPLNPTSPAEFAIPAFAASGNPWIRMPQVQVEYHQPVTASTTLLVQAAAVDPNMGDYNIAVFSASRAPGIGERGRTPGVEARVALTSHVGDRDVIFGISSHYTHTAKFRPGGINDSTAPLGFLGGGAIDYTLPFSKLFNITGELYTGRALGIFSVTSGEAILPPGSPGQRGVRSSGGWKQAQFNFSPKWQSNLAYGIDSPTVRDLPVGNRTRVQTYMGNVLYKYTPHVVFAWEYRRLLTDFSNQQAANEREITRISAWRISSE